MADEPEIYELHYRFLSDDETVSFWQAHEIAERAVDWLATNNRRSHLQSCFQSVGDTGWSTTIVLNNRDTALMLKLAL